MYNIKNVHEQVLLAKYHQLMNYMYTLFLFGHFKTHKIGYKGV